MPMRIDEIVYFTTSAPQKSANYRRIPLEIQTILEFQIIDLLTDSRPRLDQYFDLAKLPGKSSLSFWSILLAM